MTLKESLIQYTDTQKEIRELENKIRKLDNKSTAADIVDSSSTVFPYLQQHLKVEAVNIRQRNTLNYYRNILQNRYGRLLKQQLQVEEFIDNLPTSRLRRIFTYRYLENYSWQKVAYMIGGMATEDSIRKEHDRFLKES